jgi:hypothetical protein
MSTKEAPMHTKSGPKGLRGWPATALWAALIGASLVLILMGLWRTAFFIYAPEPALIEKARIGALYILVGSVLSLAAAGMSAVLGHPKWIWACIAAPAVLVGGSTLMDPTSLIRHMTAFVAFPFAIAALYWGLRWGKQHRLPHRTR